MVLTARNNHYMLAQRQMLCANFLPLAYKNRPHLVKHSAVFKKINAPPSMVYGMCDDVNGNDYALDDFFD